MLSIRTLYLFLTVQLPIFGEGFSMISCSVYKSSLEIPIHGTYESYLLEFTLKSNVQYEMQHFVLHNNYETLYLELYNDYEMLYLELYNNYEMFYFDLYNCEMLYFEFYKKYETSSIVRFNDNELVLSLYDICVICKCSQKCCSAVCYENYFVKLVSSSGNKGMAYECSSEWDITRNMAYYEEKKRDLIFSNCMTQKLSQKGYTSYKFRNNRQLQFQPFYHFLFSIFKCNILEYLFYRCFSKQYDYVAYWLELYFKIVLPFLYVYCISRKEKERDDMCKKFDKKNSSSVNEYIAGNRYFNSYFFAGGRHQIAMNGEIVCEYLQSCTETKLLNNSQYFKGKQFDFKGYKLLSAIGKDILDPIVPLFYSKIPLDRLSMYLNLKELEDISILHKIAIPKRADKKEKLTYFSDHYCTQCDLYVSVFTERMVIKKVQSKKEKKSDNYEVSSKFPPDPPSNVLLESIIKGFCNDTAPQNFIERGCAVCGTLSSINDMILLSKINVDLNIISPGDIGRYERLHESDPIMPLKGPILAENCDHVCRTCQLFLKKNKMPLESLANSFWIGSIPLVLQNLTFAEKMLISKIRHNKCLVRVSSGRAKMTANVIMFSNPTVKVYHALPPSRREISEILAFVFQGPIQPTESDIKRTPMLVRRNIVKDALEWLKLNHVDYEDLHISFENLNDYPLAGVPVNIEYSKSDPESGNKIVSAMSVYDNKFEDGTTDGPCPFTVHGLTGPEFENMSIDRLKARALQHLAEKGSTLGICHDSKPQSMYDNPQAYPQMFPWLFPYGFGGIGQKCHFAKVSETTHKKKLLMYHDKRFQTDFYFPMIAFNHEQLKAGVTGSFLLTKRKMWPNISNRLKSLNHDVLKNISDKLSSGEHFLPTSTEEKKCFRLLNDLDHVGGFVKGSITSKKHMRNEIWSMISQLGAPSWFITLSPADSRHPICLYYADKNIEFRPNLRSANERNMLVAQNPVAAARFFDMMIRMFIKHVLGIGVEHSGLYGNTAGYYGTVEQQGRLTLHLHKVLWIKNALSPQEIRDKIMNGNDTFQQNLIQYLEGCQKGEFLTGTMEHV